MGNEIKYRIYWQGKFHYWGYLDEGEGLMFVSPPSGGGLTIEEAQDRSEQFIGMKDKKGVEIYAGDRINEGVVEWFENLKSDGGGSLPPGLYFRTDYNVGLEECEILGNIHENPELLNG